MSTELVNDPSMQHGVFTGIGAGFATLAALIYKRYKTPSMSVRAHNEQALRWSENTNSNIIKTNELLVALTTVVTKLADIAERQEERTTKIWEAMLRKEAKE